MLECRLGNLGSSRSNKLISVRLQNGSVIGIERLATLSSSAVTGQGPKHILVGLVISCTENKLGFRVLAQQSLDNLALVDNRRTNLEILLADQDLDRELGEDCILEMVLTFLSLELAKLWIGHAVVPGQRRSLVLNKRP